MSKFGVIHFLAKLTSTLTIPRCSPTAPPILKNISLTIAPGEKIAICGPSGGGKTSLILSILRMNAIRSGSLSINGRDILTFTDQDIHTLTNVIPQDPLVVPGSVRLNIDPFNLTSDEDIKSALQRVGLWSRIQTETGGNQDERDLDTDLTNASTSWSVGERQLLALARTIAVPRPIIILDEATSSVDGETESKMQELIETELASQTVLAVVHRFRFIDRFDRVAVLKDGNLVECDKPQNLLGRDTEFRRLYNAHYLRSCFAILLRGKVVGE